VPRTVQQARDGAAFAFFHLRGQQSLEVADVGLSLAGGRLGQAQELGADGGHAQRLAVLAHGLPLQPDRRAVRLAAHHAAPAHSSAS
jgi:hypothetical protein